MPRDNVVKTAFEVADDGMQGVLGYFFYVMAAKKAASDTEITRHLPNKSIQITYDWERIYSPSNLLQEMNKYFEPYHARISLISTIGMFEGAVTNFYRRLISTNKIIKVKNDNYYKTKLKWSFELTSQSTYATVKRIPELCLNVDHARRIRNLWMHNNGLFDPLYEKDCIPVPGHTSIIDPLYLEYKKARGKKRNHPVIINQNTFLVLTYSHIELLHHLHHVIQKTYFGQKRDYSYKTLKKEIEWHRLLIGL